MPISQRFHAAYLNRCIQGELSLHKTDPVLFKGMLVFLQREPSTKVTTDMINLESILNQIKSEQAAAFVILKEIIFITSFIFIPANRKWRILQTHHMQE